jgi:hypothetical protein
MRKRGSVLAVLFAVLGSLVVTTAPAQAAGSCYASGVHYGYSTYTCNLYRTNHPWGMWGSANFHLEGNVVGVLGAGDSWFVCQRKFGITLEYGGGVVNNWFAYTLADNGYWGWASATHFSAGGNMEPVPGLGYCPSGFGESSTYPGDRPAVGAPARTPGPDNEKSISIN